MDDSLMQTYKRYPLSFSSGKGSYLYTKKGDEYLDFMSGVAVNALGHSHPKLVKAIQNQAEKLLHVSNYYHIEEQEKLAKTLTDLTGYHAVFFCNSGAESNEAALKLARKYTGREVFVSFKGSFHGRTFGSLSVTGKAEIQKDFQPLLPTARMIEWNDEKALEEAMQKDVAAIIFEFIQGEGGVNVASKKFIQKIFSLAKKNGILTIADEVQTGIGRTGTLLAAEQFGVQADITSLAKGLGGGVAIGAILATKEVSASFSPGSHGSTFGGNPLASSAALAVLSEVKKTSFLQNLAKNSQYFFESLEKIQKRFPDLLLEVRGMGFLIGIEIKNVDVKNTIIGVLMKKHKILVISAGEKTLRILPPLTANKKEIDIFLKAFEMTLGSI